MHDSLNEDTKDVRHFLYDINACFTAILLTPTLIGLAMMIVFGLNPESIDPHHGDGYVLVMLAIAIPLGLSCGITSIGWQRHAKWAPYAQGVTFLLVGLYWFGGLNTIIRVVGVLALLMH